jgi:hypothetical protein
VTIVDLDFNPDRGLLHKALSSPGPYQVLVSAKDNLRGSSGGASAQFAFWRFERRLKIDRDLQKKLKKTAKQLKIEI